MASISAGRLGATEFVYGRVSILPKPAMTIGGVGGADDYFFGNAGGGLCPHQDERARSGRAAVGGSDSGAELIKR
jgi:hypothetical protein